MELYKKYFKYILKKILPVEELIYVSSIFKRRREGGYFQSNFLGHELWVYIADKTSTTWYKSEWKSDARLEFEELKKLEIPQTAQIFDIGAHQGIVSILLKRILAPSGTVVSIEMDKANHEACIKNCRKNGDSEIKNIHAAIGSEAGYIRSSGRSNSEVVLKAKLPFLLPKVKTVTLDELCERFGVPDLVYMDVEGAEILAIKGANSALGQVRHWFIEMHGDAQCAKFGGTNDDLLNFFRNGGYKIKYSPAENAPFQVVEEDFQTSKRGFLIAYR